MLAGMGGMGAPNPRYLGAPIGWPGPAYREVPRRNSVGPLSRGYGCTVASVSCRSAGRCGPGAPSRSRSRVQEQLRDARRGSRWRPQCRGGVCSPRKREGPGLRPPFGLVAGKLPGAARPDPLLGNGAAGGGAGDHPGRATPLLASPPAPPPPPPPACLPSGRRREGGRTRRGDALAKCKSGETNAEKRYLLADPAKTQRLLFTTLCLHSLPLQSTLSTEASHLSKMRI